MARECLVFGPQGETGTTIKLFTESSDTEVVNASSAEETNRKGWYKANFNSNAGLFIAQLHASDDSLLSSSWLLIEAKDGVYTGKLFPPIQKLQGQALSSGLDEKGKLTFVRGSSVQFPVTGLGDLTDAEENGDIWVAGKAKLKDGIGSEIFKISYSSKLEISNKAVITSPDDANGTITITDLVAGDILVDLAAVEIAKYPLISKYGRWGAQFTDTTGTYEKQQGDFRVELDVIQETS